MLRSIEIDDRVYRLDDNGPIDISIPLHFNGAQPNAYGVEAATAKACEAGDLVGDTRRGGSCNFERYTLIPHCNGTHTECVGHITHERVSVRDSLRDAFSLAVLLSIWPEELSSSDETYTAGVSHDDLVITRGALHTSLRTRPTIQRESETGEFSALIVRTLPNDYTKLDRKYVDRIAPYFTTEAMQYIVDIGIRHLIVDVPSIDRLYDEGRLMNHRIFWNVEQGSFEATEESRSDATITEFAYVANDEEDGAYLLNLQIAPFASDASPSRPLLFRLSEN